jgi:hypothetical protein
MNHIDEESLALLATPSTSPRARRAVPSWRTCGTW